VDPVFEFRCDVSDSTEKQVAAHLSFGPVSPEHWHYDGRGRFAAGCDTSSAIRVLPIDTGDILIRRTSRSNSHARQKTGGRRIFFDDCIFK
jgi:hypothetical protein